MAPLDYDLDLPPSCGTNEGPERGKSKRFSVKSNLPDTQWSGEQLSGSWKRLGLHFSSFFLAVKRGSRVLVLTAVSTLHEFKPWLKSHFCLRPQH